MSIYYVQTYHWHEGRLQLSAPVQLEATSHDGAAEGTFKCVLSRSGTAHDLAAKVWRVRGFKPDIVLYYY